MIRLIACILLFILSFQSGGYKLYFYIAHKAVQEKVAAQIHTASLPDQLVKFQIPLYSHTYKTLDWHDEHEFMLNGQMYDVISSSVKNDIMYMTCFHDLHDTELMADLLDFISIDDILEKITQQLKKIIKVGSDSIIINDLTLFFARYDFYIIQLFPELNIKRNNSGYSFFVFQPPEFQ